MKQACTQHCDEHFSFENLVEEIENLLKNTRWFQKGDCDMYSFRHTFVYEIVAYHFGKNNKNTLLASIGYNYIAEKVPLVNEMNEECQTGLTLPVDIETLQERLLAVIRDTKNFDVFTNACWENLSFCNTFQRSLQGLRMLDIEKLFWGSKHAENVTGIYETKHSENEKSYIPLEYNESEWFRQKLLEDRSEKVIEKRIQYEMKMKAISWVIGYGISRILPDILEEH